MRVLQLPLLELVRVQQQGRGLVLKRPQMVWVLVQVLQPAWGLVLQLLPRVLVGVNRRLPQRVWKQLLAHCSLRTACSLRTDSGQRGRQRVGGKTQRREY